MNGTLIGTLPVSYTGVIGRQEQQCFPVPQAFMIYTWYLRVDLQEDLFKVDYWKFDEKKAAQELVAINAETDKYELDADSTENTAKITVKAIYADGTSRDVTAEAVATADKKVL